MLNIALPKGRLGDKVASLLCDAGYDCPTLASGDRRLTVDDVEHGVRYIWVKPSDVAIYVERGAADAGVVGKDTLLEQSPDVYELCDLGIGKCRMAVAAPAGFYDDGARRLRVATKYPNIARGYYMKKGRDIDIIKLSGSIETAPVIGMSDVIVDIVETGQTLKENNLAVTDTVVEISARLVANKSSCKFARGEIMKIADAVGKKSDLR